MATSKGRQNLPAVNDENLYQAKSEILKALAHPIRLAILDVLRDGEQCVCDIASAVSAERSNVSRHLAVMTHAGVLTSRKEGLMVYYKLLTPCIQDFFCCINDVIRQRLRQQQALLKKL